MTSMTDDRAASPIQPCALWCSHHADYGQSDQECQSDTHRLIPETSVSSDPTHVRARLVEHAERDGAKWTVEPPAVVLRVGDGTAADLTMVEARELAAALLDLVAIAELGDLTR